MKKVIIIFMLIVFLKFVLELSAWFSFNFYPSISDEILYSDTTYYFTISGRVLFRDNDEPVNSGYVKALRYDWERDLIITVDSSAISNQGHYTLSKCPQDSLDIMAYGDDEMDFVPGFHDSTISWLNAVTIYPVSNFRNANIKVNRIIKQSNAPNHVSGRILKDPHNPNEAIKDAIIYARITNKFKRYSISDENGYYRIDSLPTGNFEIIVCRIGYYSDYRFIQVGQYNTDSVNFYLARVAGGGPPVEHVPEKYSLHQNYPNPFNPVTKIKFDIPASTLSSVGEGQEVRLIVYDVLGREVATLVNEQLKPGTYVVEWDGTNYPSGMYFYKLVVSGAESLTTADFSETRKMILIK